MASTRRALRLAIASVLSNATTGFNPTLASIAATYGITAFTIDWTYPSKNLFYGFLPPDTDLSGIAEYPAFVIYTSNSVNEHKYKPKTFSGLVIAHVDCWLQFRTGAEQWDTESVCEAVEDAVVSCFEADAAAWPPSVQFTGEYQGNWLPIAHLEDGWERILPMQFLFQIDA
jgi:hypothetical protein